MASSRSCELGGNESNSPILFCLQLNQQTHCVSNTNTITNKNSDTNTNTNKRTNRTQVDDITQDCGLLKVQHIKCLQFL